jgi:hypothetical protein
VAEAGSEALTRLRRGAPAFYYGWVSLGVAALAMVGTLPGRTQGLGLVTEPLMRDLGIGRVAFAEINLVATLGLALLPRDRPADRSRGQPPGADGRRARARRGRAGDEPGDDVRGLLLLVTLTRGFGQSALSVASLALVGKWFSRRSARRWGFYAVAMSVGFMAAVPAVGAAVSAAAGAPRWAGIGWALLLVCAPLTGLFARSTPESCGLRSTATALRAPSRHAAAAEAVAGATLAEALRTPAFWVFALGAAVYGLVASGIASSTSRSWPSAASTPRPTTARSW